MRVLGPGLRRRGGLPDCGLVSQWVHSRYERRLADTASGGQEMLIHLQARWSLLPERQVPEGDVRALSVPLPQVAILAYTRVGRCCLEKGAGQ